ncbi:MAG: undecaprenyldiphospho-muramoylpentapeptide beta-N-acetylglucosaminyltransferase [Burkholderiales bacterium]|jgi:UDP-N-acetylglucosamine--N-acetylmuramyl-(pentapeptide) pyrophosphoryl-undecaprenol N-acetylglucosamine transferase|nr:undecaprenyldiphospho-muramoylpentapeptide beta-N-acetylglucosaminyltransferase [Burkholderiales bacterium]
MRHPATTPLGSPDRSKGESLSAQREGSRVDSSRHLLVVAAGTGGHVMPGLAVADELQARGWTVSWLGTRAGMERRLVEGRGIAFDAIDFAGLRGKGIKTLLFGGFLLLRALWQSRAIVRMRQPAMVFSTGGYVAVPAGLAATALGRPLALLNADASPLLSLRILRSQAVAIFCGFDGAAARMGGERALVTGNPVRPPIAQIAPPAQRYAGRSGPLSLLVVGGSLGAQVLNEILPLALARIEPARRPGVVHQCGAQHLEATRAAYARAGVAAEVVPFIDDMAARYAAADLAICRAGAITVTELTAAGVPAVLVPFVVKTTAHQRSNAEFLAAHGAAIHLPQAEFTAERLAQVLGELDRDRLQRMAEQARALGKPEATRVVADAIEHIVRSSLKAAA